MKAWKIILLMFFLISIAFYLGFTLGFDSGFIEGSKPQFEFCGYLYRDDLGIFAYDLRNIKINISYFNNSNETL
ncbi:MAG: hypothetical protein ACFFDN_06920 [Candidatus Hodarchaeota archaeon]